MPRQYASRPPPSALRAGSGYAPAVPQAAACPSGPAAPPPPPRAPPAEPRPQLHTAPARLPTRQMPTPA
eukprot:3181227-Prymnesium_polylepis.1